MAIHLIIDGYNLIRQSRELSEIEVRDLAEGREALLSRLAEYRRRRPGHKITVVFDGQGAGGPLESRDRQHGITVVYSKRGEAADDVIKRLLSRERGRAVVVSSDRELQAHAQGVGAAWIGAPAFESQHLRGGEGGEEGGGEAADFSPSKGEPPGPRAKKGPARRLPKAQRRRQQRLRKL